MDKYSLNGFYFYERAPDGLGNLEGKIAIDEHGLFKNNIIDHGSKNPGNCYIDGFVHFEKKRMEILFLKFMLTNNLPNTIYKLRKKEDNGMISGEYFGEWRALPHNIIFNKDYSILVNAFNQSASGIRGYTELILKKMI